MEFQHPVRFTLLLGAALVTTYLVFDSPSPPDDAGARTGLGLGYYVKNATLTGTGPDGQVLYRVTTLAAEQLRADGTVTLEDVNVDYAPAAEVPWRLKAAHGRMPKDRNIIELSGEVVAETDAAASPAIAGARRRKNAAPLLIRTDYLELDPEAHVASTEHLVTVERDRDTLHSRGMRVYLKQDRLQFESEVRGR
ncbi:MAG: LPS export ABC transporter periplasmic protein LptC, partial [Gammaproteobacteria bacterium]